MLIAYIMLAVLISGLLGLTGGLLLLYREKRARKYSPFLVSYAAGALFSAAFLGLIPEMVEINVSQAAFASILGGIIIFFVLERFLSWYHHHMGNARVPIFNYMIIIGDTMHNFIDGVIIAAAFIADFALGVTTTLAVLLHEVPQEIGDFGVLLHGRMKRKSIIFYNVLSALVALAGAAIAYFFLLAIEGALPFFIGIAAGGFIYIAGTDLIPETRKERKLKPSILHAIIFLIGILTIWLAGLLV